MKVIRQIIINTSSLFHGVDSLPVKVTLTMLQDVLVELVTGATGGQAA